MRLAILIFFILGTYSLSAQKLLDKKISINFEDKTIYQSIKLIEYNNPISFSYNANNLKQESKLINFSFKNETLQNILTKLFNETNLGFKEIGNQITIYNLVITKTTVRFSGYLLNVNSHEKLIGAQIYFPVLKQGCLSNAYGYFHLNIPKGKHQFIIKSIGMTTKIDSIYFNADLKVNIELKEAKTILKTIEVSNVTDAISKVENDISSLHKIEISNTQITQFTTSNGLLDVTKNIQQISGVQPTSDGSSSFIVRGLSNGNNLILLDEIPIYHPNHLLGIYSIINSSAIKSTTFYKDYIPAKFGTRNSSVLSIYTKEGDMKKFNASVGVGASVPFINIEGPLIIDKASFFIALRKSTNPLQELNLISQTNLPDPDFYDVTIKLNSKVNFQNKIYLTSYFGKDKIEKESTNYSWGNKALSFRWNRIIGDDKFSNLTAVYNTFNYKIESENNIGNISQIVKTNKLKYNVTHYISNSEKLNYGCSTLNTKTKTKGQNEETIFINRNTFETSFYATQIKTVSSKLKYELGLRIPFNFHIGSGDSATFLNSNMSYTPVYYKKNKLYDLKISFDPRFILSYQINKKNIFQFSSIINTQFTHVLSYNTNIFPVEIWTTSTKYLKPERNFQSAIGLTNIQPFFKNSITIFGRHVSNVIDYANKTFTGEKLGFESNLLSGQLNIYGIEVMTEFQKTEKYKASISYSYNYARQKIEGINNNLPYRPLHFRPHFMSFNQYFIKSNKWEFGTNFVVHSKTAITLPTSKATIDGVEYPIYNGIKNTSYLPYYHRLDLSIKRTLGIKKQKNRGYFVLTLVNIYRKNNVSNAFLGTQTDNPNLLEYKYQNYTPSSLYLTYFIKF